MGSVKDKDKTTSKGLEEVSFVDTAALFWSYGHTAESM